MAWTLFGAILGPVAIFLLWDAPPGRCAHCRSSVRGWQTICEWCGMSVRGGDEVANPSVQPAYRASGPERSSMASPADEPANRIPANGVPANGVQPGNGASGPDHPLITIVPTRRPSDPPAQAASTRKAKAGTSKAPSAVAAKSTAVPSKAKSVAAAQSLGSAVFVTGTVGLVPGSRYTIQVQGGSLQVVGPIPQSPKVTAFERELGGLEASGVDGQLVISAPGRRGGTVLVFQAPDGGDPSAVARTIVEASGASVDRSP